MSFDNHMWCVLQGYACIVAVCTAHTGKHLHGTIFNANFLAWDFLGHLGKNVNNTFYNCVHRIYMNAGFPGGSVVKDTLARQETWVRSLDPQGSLEKEMATHSSILAWRIPGMGEPGGLPSNGVAPQSPGLEAALPGRASPSPSQLLAFTQGCWDSESCSGSDRQQTTKQ